MNNHRREPLWQRPIVISNLDFWPGLARSEEEAGKGELVV